jgi:hypothetical protein
MKKITILMVFFFAAFNLMAQDEDPELVPKLEKDANAKKYWIKYRLNQSRMKQCA